MTKQPRPLNLQEVSDLLEVLEYLENKEDVRDGDEGRVFPNEEMYLAEYVRNILRQYCEDV